MNYKDTKMKNMATIKVWGTTHKVVHPTLVRRCKVCAIGNFTITIASLSLQMPSYWCALIQGLIKLLTRVEFLLSYSLNVYTVFFGDVEGIPSNHEMHIFYYYAKTCSFIYCYDWLVFLYKLYFRRIRCCLFQRPVGYNHWKQWSQ